MPDHVLITPLGRSPGAVSGMALALRQNMSKYPISRVIAIGTVHPEVKSTSSWLKQLFLQTPIDFHAEFIPFSELMGTDASADSFMIRMGQVLAEVNGQGHTVHVGVTSGRSGMGALAALATNIYGADYLWHLWVSQEIEDGGRIDRLKSFDTNNKYLNPTLAPGEFELVSLPFLDLRPLHPILVDYYAEYTAARAQGRQPVVLGPLAPIVPILVKMGAKRLEDIFPADLSVSAADRLAHITHNYQIVQTSAEREALSEELLLILGRFNVADQATIDRLKNLVRSGGSAAAALNIVAADTARPQFWKFVREHKDELSLTVDSLAFLVASASFYLQWVTR